MFRLTSLSAASSSKRLGAGASFTGASFSNKLGRRFDNAAAPSSRLGGGYASLHTVSLQLDYYMSPQFAGVACAVTNDLYEKAGIDLKFLPICPVGLEMRRVRDHADAQQGGGVTVGSVEQNIFIPTLYDDPTLGVRAVAANFRRSPLCLASLSSSGAAADKEDDDKVIIGAHEDTVSLIERIVSPGGPKDGTADRYSVIASPRATKIADLKSGTVGAIQAYTTTEVPTLERQLGKEAVAVYPLEGMNGARLGYSQVLFAPEEDILDQAGGDEKRDVLRSFLDVTFRGWEMAIRNGEDAARSVDECRAKLGLDEEGNDHWEESFSYTVQNVGLCCDAVKETFQGDRLGVIDAERWNGATEWLLDGNFAPSRKDFGLDTSGVWRPPANLLAGNELGRRTMENAKQSAEEFLREHGRKPSLVVITVGELGRYAHAEKRLRYFSNGDYSWFSKTSAGEANGIDVKEINLPDESKTDDVLSVIYAHRDDADAFQLMWPLPDHVDATRCYNAIDISKDADGAHFIGQLELDPSARGATPIPPVTPAAAIALLDEHGLGDVTNKSVLVVGRSRIVGSPLARMLTSQGAVVTVAHSDVTPDRLESLVGASDLVVSCAGRPGLIKAEWLKRGADVLAVGTTFVEEKDALCSDFEGDLAEESEANKFSPVPGGVGPLSLPFLFKNVVECAWSNAERKGAVQRTWTEKSGSLGRTFHHKDYDTALAFANEVNSMASEMDHHANMSFVHECVDGVEVNLSYFTYEANEVTEKDFQAAKKVNEIAAKFLL